MGRRPRLGYALTSYCIELVTNDGTVSHKSTNCKYVALRFKKPSVFLASKLSLISVQLKYCTVHRNLPKGLEAAASKGRQAAD